MKKDSFVDLDKMRVEILKEKIEIGFNEFKEEPKKQWIALRLERPLLEKLSAMIEQAEKAERYEKALREIADPDAWETRDEALNLARDAIK